MSEATSGAALAFVPGFRFAHPGYAPFLSERLKCPLVEAHLNSKGDDDGLEPG
jgi:hypothetical protein